MRLRQKLSIGLLTGLLVLGSVACEDDGGGETEDVTPELGDSEASE